jgi:predicted nucleotidyltransferase
VDHGIEKVEKIANRLTEVNGVVAVCLGGSRARGTHHPDSDYDLGLYYHRPLDTDALRALAAELTGEQVEVTEPGGWGPWVDGGAWLTIDGLRVDWIYRDLDRVHRVWNDCQDGRFEIGTQPGHPLGVYSHAYAGEVALARVLADPSGELTALKARIRTYPMSLRDALVANARWEAPFILAAARKGASRGDSFYVTGCLFRAVGLLVHALHAEAGHWLVNEKGAVESAARLATAPPNFATRAHAVFDTPLAALDEADRLAADVLDRLARTSRR